MYNSVRMRAFIEF